jgi:hypothetical protein|tara:strand:- start:2075 stop:2227 length:153 start_codon:yes stop_codon:yes gene_type:complete
VKWEKEILNWLHMYIDDVTELEIDGSKILMKVNGQYTAILSIQKLIREMK